MDGFLEFMANNKIVDVAIIAVGLFGFALVIERVKALYFDYVIDADAFIKQITSLINEDKIEEAITFCSANQKKPLAYIIKCVLEKSDRDERALHQALDIASAEVGPKLVKSLGHLAMIANVVTMVGLLGTVTGLIVAFKAVSFADPAQRQTLLVQGISIAMTATALGLMTAIPIMFIYSFLHSKQGKLFTEIDKATNKVIEAIEARYFQPFNNMTAYPADHNKEAPVVGNGKATTTRPAAPKSKAS